MTVQYQQQWSLPSRSNPEKPHIVSLKMNGEYICDCWPFRKNRTCEHIEDVQNGWAETRESKVWDICPGNVQQVTEKNGIVLVPLIPLEGAQTGHFILTIMYDLRQLGVPWATIQERYGKMLRKRVSWQQCRDYIQWQGRCITNPWVEGKGYRGFLVVK